MQAAITPTNRTVIMRIDCIPESTANASGDTQHRQYKYGKFFK